MDSAYARSMAYDFGTVLAHRQMLEHEFRIRNLSNRWIRVLTAEALTPCCSSIGPLTKSVPPDGEAVVPVKLRAGTISERKGVAFVVTTDDPDRPEIDFFLSADFVADWEVDPGESSPTVLRPGQTGEKRLRLIARRLGALGRRLPHEISATRGVAVRKEGAAFETDGESGLVREEQIVTLVFPASEVSGARACELVARWPNGESSSWPFYWTVRPTVVVEPSAITFGRGESIVERVVTVHSNAEPFRITAIEGASLCPPVPCPQTRSKSFQLRLRFDPGRCKATSAENVAKVEFKLDLAEQPVATLGGHRP